MSGSVYGLLRSARPVLVPTLLTNAFTAWVAINHDAPSGMEWVSYALIVAAGLCFYLYGMWENDRLDARWDMKFRRDKPIPRGEVSVGTLRIAGMLAGICALVLCGIQSREGVELGIVLMLVIILYNWLHKVRPESVVLMGLCRGGWVMLAGMLAFQSVSQGGSEDFFSAVAGDSLMKWYALSLAVYTIAISLMARGEAGNSTRRRWVGLFLSSMCLHDFVWLAVLKASWGILAFALVCYACSLALKYLGHSDS